MKAFYLDPLPWVEGYSNLQNNFDTIKMPQLKTSYHFLAARLLNMTYEEYLVFCRECLGAKVYRKSGAKYATIYFPETTDTKRFINLLNKKFEKGYNI